MTLVVAQLLKGVIAAVSDTGITAHKVVPLPADRYVAKLCVLSSDTTIGFAGDPAYGVEAIETLPAPYKSVEQISAHLLNYHKAKNKQTDFLVLLNKPSPAMYLVRGGRIVKAETNAWIGVKSAFDAFQHHRNAALANIMSPLEAGLLFAEPGLSSLTPVTGKLINAMRCVIDNKSVPSVFGFCVAIDNAQGFFRYCNYALVLGLRDMSKPMPAHLQELTPAQMKELNDHRLGCFVSHPDDERHAIAYHYLHGQVTYWFNGPKGLPLSNPKVVRRMNIEQFILHSERRLGIRWIGGLMSRIDTSSESGIQFKRVNPRFYRP